MANKGTKIFNNATVILKNVYFTYATLDNDIIINNVSLSCASSQIFAIVGPSGCGKTTLVKLIIGARKASHGNVTLFGYNDCDDIRKYASIPGPNLGYMPQDEAIPTDFRVYNCLYFFAILCKMNISDIKQRIHEVLQQLDLFDERNRFIWTLSGGMKRRLSLAIAILHKPQLLVLDEPTVGADPLVRRRMWQLFNDIKSSGTTIILTTHYMDECKYADEICFMRDGNILAVGTMNHLLQSTNSETLDETFVKLSKIKMGNLNKENTAEEVERNFTLVKKYSKRSNWLKSFSIFLVLIYRYFHLFALTPISIFSILGIPTFNVYLNHVVTGPNLYQVPIGIIIHNQGDYDFKRSLTQLNITPKCLPCIYPNHLTDFIDSEKFTITYYNSSDDALKDIENYKIRASLYINDRFTEAHFQKLTYDWSFLNEGIIKSSQIQLNADMVNQPLSAAIELYLSDAYLKFWKSSKANLSLKSVSPFPFEYMNSVIDNKKPEDEDGRRSIILSQVIMGFLSGGIMISGCALISEIEDKTMERYSSIGLKVYQMFFSQLTSNTIYLTFAGCLALINTIFLLDEKSKADLLGPFAIIVLTVVVSVLIGQLIAIVSMSRVIVVMISIFITLFCSFCQDYHVSQEGYPYFLRDSLTYLPYYASGRCLRSLVLYGHDIYHPNVVYGYICNTLYIVFLCPLVYFLVKLKV